MYSIDQALDILFTTGEVPNEIDTSATETMYCDVPVEETGEE